MTEEQRFQSDGVRRVNVDVDSGDVHAGWIESGDIVVYGSDLDVFVEADELFVTTTTSHRRSGKTVNIELPLNLVSCGIKLDRGDVHLSNAQGKVDVALQSGDAHVDRGNGEIAFSIGKGDAKVFSFNGEVIVNNGSGDAHLSEVNGDVTVRAGKGDVHLTGGAGRTTVAIGSGDMHLNDRDCGEATLADGKGDITIGGGRLGRAEITTSSGDIHCQTDFAIASYDFTASSGDISITIPRELPARVDAATTRGNISTDLPLVAIGQRGPRNPHGKRLVGSTSDDADRADLTLRTSSGDISVRWANGNSAPFSAHITRKGSDRDIDIRWGNGAVPVSARVKTRVGDRDIEFRWGDNPDVPAPTTPESAVAPDEPIQSEGGESDAPNESVAATPAPIASDPVTSVAVDDRKRAILSALADGSITIEEANYLLDAIDRSDSNTSGA